MRRLREAFMAFDRKMKGYLTNEAVVHAPETRTSSPVRIPREPERLVHPEVDGLYPCGEGAGYAGGIISAAMDGRTVVRGGSGMHHRQEVIFDLFFVIISIVKYCFTIESI